METIRIPFTLSILTPFHIGTGEDIDPLSIVVKDKAAYRLNQMGYIQHLLQNHKAELEKVLATKDIKAMHRFFHERFDPDLKDTWFFSYPLTEEVAVDYVQKMDQASNQGLIREFIRSQIDLRPYIPGSSIKGAVRTAILSALNGDEKIKGRFDKFADQNHQAKLLNYYDFEKNRADIPSDPFKFIKFADIPFTNDWISVNKVEVINPNPPKPRDPARDYRPRAQIQGKEPAIPVYMELGHTSREARTLASELDILITNKDNPGIKKILPRGKESLPGMIQMIKEYYRGQFAKEKDIYLQIQNGAKIYDNLEKHFAYVAEKSNESLIRIGYGTGQNYCTYASMNYAPKSRKMVKHIPLGWFRISFDLG